jgi:hypothetical protein
MVLSINRILDAGGKSGYTAQLHDFVFGFRNSGKGEGGVERGVNQSFG